MNKSKPLEFISYLEDPLHNIPDNILFPAIFDLWQKNIFTIHSSINEKEGIAYIVLHGLDETNDRLFNDLVKMTDGTYTYEDDGFKITQPLNEDTTKNMMTLVSPFVMQEPQYGFYTKEEFLTKFCGCSKRVFVKGSTPNLSLNGEITGEDETTTYEEVFDESKQTKSLEEYAEEQGVHDLLSIKDGKVFFNHTYYNCHLKYNSDKNKSYNHI